MVISFLSQLGIAFVAKLSGVFNKKHWASSNLDKKLIRQQVDVAKSVRPLALLRRFQVLKLKALAYGCKNDNFGNAVLNGLLNVAIFTFTVALFHQCISLKHK